MRLVVQNALSSVSWGSHEATTGALLGTNQRKPDDTAATPLGFAAQWRGVRQLCVCTVVFEKPARLFPSGYARWRVVIDFSSESQGAGDPAPEQKNKVCRASEKLKSDKGRDDIALDTSSSYRYVYVSEWNRGAQLI
eukprot:5248463-Amphidinium_carterae.1